MTASMTNRIAIGLFAGFLGLVFAIPDADARRLGGGRSFGKQSGNYSKREAPAQQNTAAPKQADANPAQPQPGATPQPQRNRWLGPIAGLAAGLGIAALLSHLGLGGAFAEMLGSLLLIAGLVIAGLFVYRMLRGARPAPTSRPAYAGADTPPRGSSTFDVQRPVARDTLAPSGPVSVTGEPLRPLAGAGESLSSASTATWSIPADFDVEGFLRSAKVYFVRLQAAWDAGDQADIREFTTPEMFAEIKLDLAERGAAANQTDVVELQAELLGIEEQGRNALASVRFHGLLRESPATPAAPFSEVWNLVKPLSDKHGWLLAGIQQDVPA